MTKGKARQYLSNVMLAWFKVLENFVVQPLEAFWLLGRHNHLVLELLNGCVVCRKRRGFYYRVSRGCLVVWMSPLELWRLILRFESNQLLRNIRFPKLAQMAV